jgi:hypothetical protein
MAARMSTTFTRTGSRLRQPGGTPGGLGKFVIGLLLTVVGLYLVFQQTSVGTGYWSWWGTNTFGLTLVPLIIGVGILFYDVSNVLGWLLCAIGLVIIVSGVVMNLHVYFQQTSLFNLLIMLVLIVGGLGLMARGLHPH